jgi:hypothetical protein
MKNSFVVDALHEAAKLILALADTWGFAPSPGKSYPNQR